jgi:hypothetical protein
MSWNRAAVPSERSTIATRTPALDRTIAFRVRLLSEVLAACGSSDCRRIWLALSRRTQVPLVHPLGWFNKGLRNSV